MAQEPAKSFKDLDVWQKSHAAVLEVYKLTRRLPKEELFGLVSQMRRSAVSVPANIAEGFKRKGKADKARHMNIAQASLEECGITSSFVLTSCICHPMRSVIDSKKSPGCSGRTRRRFWIPDSDF